MEGGKMIEPKCDYCKRFIKDPIYRCEIYPDGIPVEVNIFDKEAECAPGIKYESKNPELEHKQPDENSVLSKMLHQFR